MPKNCSTKTALFDISQFGIAKKITLGLAKLNEFYARWLIQRKFLLFLSKLANLQNQSLTENMVGKGTGGLIEPPLPLAPPPWKL